MNDLDASGEELVELYRTKGLPEAYALKNAIADAGVLAFVDNELLQGAVGEVPMGWHTTPRILVPAGSRDIARNVLEAFLQEAAASSSSESDEDDLQERCLSCGEVMAEESCPACGWSWEADDEEVS